MIEKIQFINNPCLPEGIDSPMVLISTGIKDFIGGYGGENDEGKLLLLLPLAYQDVVQQAGPEQPPRISAGMQPVYLPLGALDRIEVIPVLTYFFDGSKSEDQQVVSGYKHIISKLTASHVIQPSASEIRKLTVVPK